MDRIGIRELRQHASRHLERVKAGESIEVTDRGIPFAVISPLAPADLARQRMITEGRLIPAKRPLHLPERRSPRDGISTEAALEAERAERL